MKRRKQRECSSWFSLYSPFSDQSHAIIAALFGMGGVCVTCVDESIQGLMLYGFKTTNFVYAVRLRILIRRQITPGVASEDQECLEKSVVPRLFKLRPNSLRIYRIGRTDHVPWRITSGASTVSGAANGTRFSKGFRREQGRGR